MYQVVLLIEQPLSRTDAHQIAELHESVGDVVHVHVLLPIEDASHRVETALGSIAASEVLSTSALNFPDVDPDELQREVVEHSQLVLDRSIDALGRYGCEASGQITTRDPVTMLIEVAQGRDAQEAIVLTRPHLVAELFHLDWASKARRHCGVPVLHLLEHRDPDTFEEAMQPQPEAP